MATERICRECGNPFEAYPRARGRREQIFCNRACSNRYYNKQSRRIPLTLTDEQRRIIDSLLDMFQAGRHTHV